MKKRVYITESHHHVIREWFRYRGRGMHLLSFDYHTDFREAFIGKFAGPSTYSRELHNSYLRKHIPCNDVDAAIKDLRNDEHIDFALRSGMIEKAFVFSHSKCGDRGRVLSVPPIVMSEEQVQIVKLMKNFAPKVWKGSSSRDDDISHDLYADARVEQAIVSFSEYRHPLLQAHDESQMAKLVMTDAILHEVLEIFCKHGFDQDNYILDFDCDFIRDREAMTHGQFHTLKELIRGARAITIAREPYYVDECSGQTLSCEEIETWLLNLIKEYADDVEIEYES